MKLSIVIPAYNEEKRIGRTLEAYSTFFTSLKKTRDFSYLLFVVINGTTDNTEEVVKSFKKKNRNISYINLPRGGKGYAITEGFKFSIANNYDLIGFADADLATPPQEFFKLISSIRNFDGAIADRYSKYSRIIPAFTFRRLIVSRVFNFLVRVLFLLPYKDTQCGAKLFKKEALEKILKDLTITQWAYDIDLLFSCKKNNFKIISVPTVWYEVSGSKLKINRTSIEMLLAIIQLRILRSRFRRVLKIFKPIIAVIYKSIKNK